ncbi:MAG: patatin-like phospholipase family protein, partial [Bacteroidales bacterium]|nr:patatin-like phospholipase family protein [Bacteroidales bacterium]
TSMGALVGGVYAAGKMNEFKEWAYNLTKQDIFKLLDFSFTSQGLIKGEKLLNAMKKFIPDANIEDLGKKYTATAFDLAQNKEIVFRKGSLYEAIRASISIPTVFTPVMNGDSVIVDGGVVNNIPIANSIRSTNDFLIAVNVNAAIPVLEVDNILFDKNEKLLTRKTNRTKKGIKKRKTIEPGSKIHYLKLINSIIAFMTNHLATTLIKNTPPDLLIEISKHTCWTFDFHKAAELAEIGRFVTRSGLDSVRISAN